jgi:outer membrane immunogenic protein
MSHKLLGVIGVTAALLCAPLAASAADMGIPYKAPPPPPPPVSWTGCYVDAGWGYGLWNQDQYQETNPGLVATSGTYTEGGRGWLGRFGGGCDYQLGGGFSRWVVGAFADYDFMDLHGNYSPGSTIFLGEEKETGAWYAGGRIGYLVTPSLLTYTSGGWTQTHFDQINLGSLTATPVAPSFMPGHTYSGWFIGGGTEYALDLSWLPIHGLFWRNEYRFAEYGSADLPIITAATGASTIAEHEQKYVQTITSSLVWRFNWTGH